MKISTSFFVLCLTAFAPLASAYEYILQFTPNPGYRDLVVAGYGFESNGTVVMGNCSYSTTSPTLKRYFQTCRWDLNGNLISITPGAPAIPLPISVDGSQVTFATNAAGDSTGADLASPEHGFVSTPGAHYTWAPPQNPAVLRQGVYSLTATLKNDGDLPLDIWAVTPSAHLSKVTLNSETCTRAPIVVGDTCSITVTYDDTAVKSPIGLALDTLRVDLTSNAGAGPDFIEVFTLVVAKK